jgi:membrane protease YdiL (CAAX protease family)
MARESMTDHSSQEGPKVSLRDKAEVVVVAVLTVTAAIAYLVAYWPWKAEAKTSPIAFFASMPVLIITAGFAFTLGSNRLVAYWRAMVDKRPWFIWTVPIAISLLYAVGTGLAGYGIWQNYLILTVYLLIPVALARLRTLWADWAMCLAAWLPIQFDWVSLPLMPVPRQPDIWNHWIRKAYTAPAIPESFDAAQRQMAKTLIEIPRIPEPMQQVTVQTLFIACTAIWAIMVVRRLDGFNFRLLFSFEDFKFGGKLFLLFGVVALPIATLTGFGNWQRMLSLHQTYPSIPPLLVYAILPVGMYFGVALIEESLFRGILQNLLSKTLGKPWIAWALASVVFGIVHFKFGSPVLYTIFATCAGGVYGYAYMKTGRIMPGAITHAMVNSLWLILFNPMSS